MQKLATCPKTPFSIFSNPSRFMSITSQRQVVLDAREKASRILAQQIEKIKKKKFVPSDENSPSSPPPLSSDQEKHVIGHVFRKLKNKFPKVIIQPTSPEHHVPRGSKSHQEILEKNPPSPPVTDSHIASLALEAQDISSEEAQKLFPDFSLLQEKSSSSSTTHPPSPIPVESQKSLNVAIVGTPNAGKSTLLNHIMSRKVSAVSPKVQTTRSNIIGIFTQKDAQINFIDTPGIIPPENQKLMMRPLVDAAWSSISIADVILVLVDGTIPVISRHLKHILRRVQITIEEHNKMIEENKQIIDEMNEDEKPKSSKLKKKLQKMKNSDESSLTRPKIVHCVINKTDKMKEHEIIELIDKLAEYNMFESYFPISALKGDGVDNLTSQLIDAAPLKPWKFPESQISNQSDVEVVTEIIREKLFQRLNKEVPYFIVQVNQGWTVFKNGITRIDQDLLVATKGQMKVVMSALPWIQPRCVADIEAALGKEPGQIHLAFKVKLSKERNVKNMTGDDELEDSLGDLE